MYKLIFIPKYYFRNTCTFTDMQQDKCILIRNY